jgi:dinuclear metal center YbgI/SA1388 family protein
LFRPIQKIGDQTLEEKCIRACIQADIALYAAHTNLDKMLEGVSFQMAKQLDLQNLNILKLENEQLGFGYIGFLQEKMQTIDFLKRIKTVFQTDCLRYSDLIYPNVIEKVAVCGGSGFALLPHAISQKADIFITSDLKYHDFFSAYKKIVLADIGHYESEKHIISFLHEKCIEKFPIFAIYETKLNTNPINYLI